MNKDGRGTPGRITRKNEPRLRLADVLRRRRTTLKALVTELGITTYSSLDAWCGRMGIAAPSQAEFEIAVPFTVRVNSPLEGVIVLEAPNVIDERTGEPVELDACDASQGDDATADEPTVTTQKKRRSKKESQPVEG